LPAQETKPEPRFQKDNDEIEILIRVSKTLFISLTQARIETTIPVNRTDDGIRTTGSVFAQGDTHIELTTSETTSEFVVSVTGKADAALKSDAGPAMVYSSSSTNFIAQKRFSFDGINFSHGKTEVSTGTCVNVDRICPKRRGPIGRIVKKVGRCMASRQQDELNKKLDSVAQKMITDSFDKNGAILLEELNKTTDFEKAVDEYFPEVKSFRYQLATKEDALIAGVGEPDAKFPDLPPAAAHVEVWLKTRPLEAAFIKMLADAEVGHDLLREFLPEDEAKAVAEDVNVKTINGWTVIRIGLIQKMNE
jgi:hypothetical protein